MQIVIISPDAVAGAVDQEMAHAWLFAVHASMRSGHGGRVIDPVRPPGPGWNYYRVGVKDDRDADLRILLNAAAGVIAASRDEGVPQNGPLDFLEVPSPDSFRSVGLTVADADALRSLLRPQDVEMALQFVESVTDAVLRTQIGMSGKNGPAERRR